MKILYYSGWTLSRLISKFIFRIKVSGQENFPKTGGFILATNHISYYDPLLVGSWAPRQVYFFAKKELFKNRFFGYIIRSTNALPVKRGSIDRQAIELSVDVIKRGYGLTIFPEGTRSKTDGFLEPKPGVGLLAVQAQCPIVPGYVHGSNRLKRCFWGRDKMSITFGEPFSADWVKSFPAEKPGYQRIADSVMERIGELRQRVFDKSPARKNLV
ncbi:MAG TPA: lysophospholipid acyltransferase family protein [Candidatus Acidoferrum sp.]|nr:lysophospholipid acyltransferase family protein [Candidatus Acidoferrum sp.]